MTAAAELLARCRALGITLAAGPGGALSWEADTDPPAELLADLSRHKAGLLALLTPDDGGPVGLSAADRAWACEAIEDELGLPRGSLELSTDPPGSGLRKQDAGGANRAAANREKSKP
jgi:hypothetical protein